MGDPLSNQWRAAVKTIFIPFCADQIEYHRGTIRKLKILCAFEIGLGLALTILAFVIFRDLKQLSDTLFKFGPMLLGLPIPTIQYRIIAVSRQSIISYRRWKEALEECLRANVEPEAWLTDEIKKNMAEGAKLRIGNI